MNEEAIIRGILTGAERWKAVKARQYELKIPLGVYMSDLPLCVLLAELPGTEDQIIERIEQSAAMLVRLRADSRVSSALGMGSDATAILALASIPDIDASVPAVEPAIVLVPPVAVPEPQLEVPTPTEAVPVPILANTCDHVGSDGKCSDCTGDRTVECAHCGTSIVLSSGTACKAGEDECGDVFCSECVDAHINEHGYCKDCDSLTCDGCFEDLDRGTEKKCSRTFCESKLDYCDDCAGRLLNAEGLCRSCSGEDDYDCQECNNTFTQSRLTRCANEDCGNPYCDDCRGDALSAKGFCGDCGDQLTCSRCDEEFDRGTGADCAGENCDDRMCASCADNLLNAEGFCSGCAQDDEEGDCDGCKEPVIDSRLEDCKNEECEAAFCSKCAPEYLGDNGLCSECDD